MITKDDLRQARRLKVGIMAKDERIRELYALGTDVSVDYTRDVVKSGGPSDRVSAVAACIADFRTEIEQDVIRLVEAQRAIQEAFERLPRPELTLCMELYYLNGYTWERVAELVGYSERHIRNLHSEALRILNCETVPVISGSKCDIL